MVGEFAAAVIYNEHTLNFYSMANLFKQVEEHVIDDKEPIFGMIDDIGQFIRMQPQIQSVQYRSRGGNPEIGFEVLMFIPHQSGNPVARLDAGLLQSG